MPFHFYNRGINCLLFSAPEEIQLVEVRLAGAVTQEDMDNGLVMQEVSTSGRGKQDVERENI